MVKADARDEVVYLRAAGVDVGKRFVVVCVRTPNPQRPGTWALETERFESDPGEMRRLAGWLGERGVEVVVMESTSDYWRPVYYPLQDAGLNVVLVNPAHLRGVRGRKSDPTDAAFLARAAASGMVMASFVPDRTVRELRELTRRRTQIGVERVREIQRLEKALEDSGMKLTSVLTDVTGVSSRRILQALCAGQRDPQVLAELAVAQARLKIPALIEALDGTFTAHHARMVRHYFAQIDHLAAMIAELDDWVAQMVDARPGESDMANLDTIPGIGPTAAQVILAETGGDMAVFPSPSQLASWIGVCPGMNESAGVSKSAHIRHGNANLKRILGIAAMAAIRKKDTYLAVYYRRIAARRGNQRALVAVMHKIVIAVWHVFNDHVPYRDLGADYPTKANPERALKRIVRQANALGLTVRFDPIEI